MRFFIYNETKSLIAFLGRSGSTSFVKAIIGEDKYNNFIPDDINRTVHTLCDRIFKYEIQFKYQNYKIYAVIRHPFERFQSAINHKKKDFNYFISHPSDVHTTSAYHLIKGLKVNAYKFEDGGINNCAKDMGLENFEKLNSIDHVITLTDEQKAIISEKYSKDIELWNTISSEGKEILV